MFRQLCLFLFLTKILIVLKSNIILKVLKALYLPECCVYNPAVLAPCLRAGVVEAEPELARDVSVLRQHGRHGAAHHRIFAHVHRVELDSRVVKHR